MKLTMPVLGAIVVSAMAAGCGRTEPTAENAPREAAETGPATDQEVAEFENRLDALERDWNAAQERLGDQAASTAAAARRTIDEELRELRASIDELRTTTAQNWWDRQERQLERTAERVQQDVRRVARSWTPAEASDEVATSGETSDWRARRDALVSGLERRIRDMEEALEGLDPRDPGVEQARERVQHMKDDAERVRGASEDGWWEITKARIRVSLDRVDAAIDRLAAGRV